MKHVLLHVVWPSLLPALFFAIAFTPVHVLGCRTRGLLALLVALTSAAMALIAAVTANKRRSRGDSETGWWVLRALILTIPVIALLKMA